MASSASKQPLLVQSVYSFKGKNNDELCFKKGDIITVTQSEEGGWWEGTLGEKTGWFPSNYVKEYKPSGDIVSSTSALGPKLSADLVSQQRANRAVIVNDLIDSEKAHVTELQMLINKFLNTIQHSEVMSKDEYNQLVGNILQIVDVHEKLYKGLEEISALPQNEQRVGHLFLNLAPKIKQLHQHYCASHPRAVLVIDKHKEELGKLMETSGATSPGILVLTTGLSKPFRRLDKYSTVLQELERYIEETHVDRGDIQRSVSVYKDIARECSVIRCKKEMELEILHGGIRGLEAEEINALGDIVHMGSVAIGPDFTDRYFVLFPSSLMILSVSQRMSSFIYEGVLPLMGINIAKLEDATDAYKNAFKISGNLIDNIIAVCQTKEDQQEWLNKLSQQIKAVRSASSASHSHQSVNYSLPSPPNRGSCHPAITRPVPPPHSGIPITSTNTIKPWSILNLRPSPPVRSNLSLEENKHAYSTSKLSERLFSEDAQILQVIESYCTSARSRYTINSVQTQLLDTNVKKEENCEKMPNDYTKSLADFMKEMKDEMRMLNSKMQNLSHHLEEERRTRMQLQNFIKNNIPLKTQCNPTVE